MAKITLWDKVLEKFTGYYSQKTRDVILEELLAESARQAKLARLEEQERLAAAKVLAEKEAAAKKRAAEKIAKIEAAAKPHPKPVSKSQEKRVAIQKDIAETPVAKTAPKATPKVAPATAKASAKAVKPTPKSKGKPSK